jgi:hypothetical protein
MTQDYSRMQVIFDGVIRGTPRPVASGSAASCGMMAPMEESRSGFFDDITYRATGPERTAVSSLLEHAIEIAREGHAGRKIGTIFTIGDEHEVLRRSRCLIPTRSQDTPTTASTSMIPTCVRPSRSSPSSTAASS